MRKLLTMAVSLIFIAIFALSANANGQIGTEEINFDVDRCVNIAKEFVETYYESVYSDSVFVSPIDIQDENIEILINSKLAYDRAPRALLPCKSWDIEVSLVEYNVVDDMIFIELVAHIFYTTTGSTMLHNNSSGEYFTFIKSDNNFEIVSWLTSDLRGFDLSVYGYDGLFMNMEDYINLISSVTDYSEFVQNAVEYSSNNVKFLEDLDAQQKKKAQEISTVNTLINTPRWSYGLYHTNIYIDDIDDLGIQFNRSAMVEWALDNYFAQLPVSASYSVPYKNMYFPEYYSYDCTNFISHALIAEMRFPIILVKK